MDSSKEDLVGISKRNFSSLKKTRFLSILQKTPNLVFAYKLTFVPYAIGLVIITMVSLLNLSYIPNYIKNQQFDYAFSTIKNVILAYAIWTFIISIIYFFAYVSVKLSEKNKLAIFLLPFLLSSAIVYIFFIAFQVQAGEGMGALVAGLIIMLVGVPLLAATAVMWGYSYNKFKEK